MPRWTSFDIRQHGRRVLAVLVVLVLVNVVVGLVVVQPKVREFRDLRDQYEPRRQEMQEFRVAVEARESYLARLDQAERDLAELYDEVLSTKERRMVIAQLEIAQLVRQFGVSADEYDYDNETLVDEGLDYMGMDIPLEGGYTNLRKFIEAVEESEKFLVIESVSLDQARDGGSLLQLNIRLATYFDAPADIDRMRDRQREEQRRLRGGRRRA